MSLKLTAWLLVALCLSCAALSLPPNPELYWGYAYIDNNPANGSLIAETGEGDIIVNLSLPMDPEYPGSYSIKLTFDDKMTRHSKEGATEGEKIVWKVDGLVAAITDTAERDKVNNNFSIKAFTPVNMTVGNLTHDAMVDVGEMVKINAKVENKGQIDIDGFDALLYINDSLQEKAHVNYTLNEGENLSVAFYWQADIEGNYSFSVNVSARNCEECKIQRASSASAISVVRNEQANNSVSNLKNESS